MLKIDQYLYQLINQTLHADWLNWLMVQFSNKYFWIPLYAVIVFFIIKVFKKKAIIALICLGVSVLLADRVSSGFLKPAFKRERPCHIAALNPIVLDPCHDTGSMPSSHAANHFAISVFLICLFHKSKKQIKYLLLIWAFLVAYSRVYCGVHYPADVLVGGLIGALIGWACYYNFYKLMERALKWA